VERGEGRWDWAAESMRTGCLRLRVPLGDRAEMKALRICWLCFF
jgi:hypothetical protein